MVFSRVKADDGQRLQELADTLVSAKKLVMITGAGISTSCGIPDFRSEEGLYSLIKDAHGGSNPGTIGTKGKDLFDSNLWRDEASTQTFYKFMASLRQKVAQDIKQTSMTHKFIAKLKDQRKLVRCYTQNIDGLEVREGLTMGLEQGRGNLQRFGRKAMGEMYSEVTAAQGGMHHAGCEIVPLHGDLKELRCTICSRNAEWTSERQVSMLAGQAPPCPECEEKNMVRTALGRRGLKVGALRPDIVLYGESHPSTDAIAKITEADLKMKPDVLLVMGTSLKVHGLKNMVREFAKAVHSKEGGKVIFVNLSEPAESVWKDVFDAWVEMDCDSWVADMKQRRREVWMAQAQLGSQALKVSKTAVCAKKKTTKTKALSRGQENVRPEPAAVYISSPPKVIVPVTSGLKRKASSAHLDVFSTPRKRKVPLQVVTPPSSQHTHRPSSVTTYRTPTDLPSFFERQDACATPETMSKKSTNKRLSVGTRSESALPILNSPPITPSQRRVIKRPQASLNRNGASSSEPVDLTQPTPTKARRIFRIHEDRTLVGTLEVVPETDGSLAGSFESEASQTTQEQEHEPDTIELVSAPIVSKSRFKTTHRKRTLRTSR